MTNIQPIQILIADDDAEDRLLAISALEQSRLLNDLYCVEDGEQLMEFLTYTGAYEGAKHPLPDLILLDLNMPKKNGIESLQEIRAQAELRHIPVIVLTTSQAEHDILSSYKLGVNSFITKPVSFEGLVEIMKVLKLYWFQIVKLPKNENSGVTKE